MVVQIFQFFLFISHRGKCLAVADDFHIHRSVHGKSELLLLEIEYLTGRKIQLAHNGIDGKVGHEALAVLMFESQVSLAFFYQTAGRTDKVVLLDERCLFQLLLWKRIFVVLIRHAVPAVDMLDKIPEVVLIQASELETAGDFIFQQFFHFHVAVDFIIWHGDKVVHQRMVDLIQELFERHKRRFLHAFKADLFLCYNELEADKKAVVYLIVPNHAY